MGKTIFGLILWLTMLLGGCGSADTDNSRVLIGRYEDRATVLSEDNPCRAQILDYIADMESVPQTEHFYGAKLPGGHIISDNGDRIEYGAYVEEIIDYEGMESEAAKNALYIYCSRNNSLRLYDWEYYLELDTLSGNAQYHELVGKTFTAWVRYGGAAGFSLMSEEHGDLSVVLCEPVQAMTGDIVQVTILPQDEPLTRISPLTAAAVNLSAGNLSEYNAAYAIPTEYSVRQANTNQSVCEIITDHDELEFMTELYSDGENDALTAAQAADICGHYSEEFFTENIIVLCMKEMLCGQSRLDVFAMNAPWDEFLLYLTETAPQNASQEKCGAMVLVTIPRSHWNERYPEVIEKTVFG